MKSMKCLNDNDIFTNFIIIDKLRKNSIIAVYEGIDPWDKGIKTQKFCCSLHNNYHLNKIYYHPDIQDNYDLIEVSLPFDVITCINKFL